MSIHTDSFFAIGSTHKVCQDYAIHGENYVLIGDGCSSGVDTDFGSRLLLKSVEPYIKGGIDRFNGISQDELVKAASSAFVQAKALGLDDTSLLSTLVGIYKIGNYLHAFMVGDGTFAWKHVNGDITIHEVEFTSGAPYYLAYELNANNKKIYFETFGNTFTYKIGRYTAATDTYSEEVTQGLHEFNEKRFLFEDFGAETEFTAIFSDGVNSFMKDQLTATSKQIVPYPKYKVIKEALNIKGYSGEFVQRRCQKMLKQFRADGIQHLDDFSMAAIKFDMEN